ncbi:fimbrial biogenesis usher protein [Proteus myxofaciens]|uniref:FimD family fimbriae anchoring protein n=1 Tax=Proteus myxofaciens ATCC 19692 TaxID=1354337 RepID=A0A198GKK3_9GAMM|nr:fimbrial biogenesis usher protein [Proteus myxofaciens]OAT36726.1 FimD family fimbriae anchoring protein [Proteus myxofaciens ATCC 19692]
MSYLVSKKRLLVRNEKKYFRYNSKFHFPIVVLTFFIGFSLFPFETKGEGVYFNPRFLGDDPSTIADLSTFEKGQEVPEGTYRVDIFLNGTYTVTRDVRFILDKKSESLSPCLSKGEMVRLGISTLALSKIETQTLDTKKTIDTKNNTCHSLVSQIKGSTAVFDVGLQQLNITVPQIFMNNDVRDFIPPELWDSGIKAAILNYNLTGSTTRNQTGKHSTYTYLSLQSGVNLGAWRFRDNSIWNHSTSGSGNRKTSWEHIATYIERGINQIRSRLTIGDSYTTNDIFESFNFRGIQLASDKNMLPESLRGFAPVIRGVARGTADVSIKQNGYEIYRNTFPPGPFVIDDLYSGGNSGDLEVTITEKDGSKRTFTVPYSSVPLLQREGHTEYAVTLGNYRSGNSQQNKPVFLQGSLLHGLSNGWTLYGGMQLANHYQSINAGIGKNIGAFGALSIDVTHANSELPDDSDHQGQSIRFLYNKSISETGTSIRLAGYRYSTSGYYSFADTTYKRMSGRTVLTEDGLVDIEPKFADYYNLLYNKRAKIQLSLTQQIAKQATMYITGSHETYWNTNKSDRQLQVGVNTQFKGVNLGVSYSLSKNSWQDENDQLLAVNVNVPFSNWLRSDSDSIWRNANVSYSGSHDLKGRMNNTVGLFGTLLKDNNLNYSVQTGYAGGGHANSSGTSNTSLNYRGAYGNANIGYSYSNNYRQTYYGISGGAIAHANGVTLSQPLNDTVILIKAPGANNVRVENQSGVATDWRGYAVIPYATEYRENRVALDTNTLANNVDLEDSVMDVIPTRGAVVQADFKPKVGVKVLMTIFYNNKPIPFGATVSLENNQGGSIATEGGQVYLTGLPLKGQLTVNWGEEADKTCHVTYSLPEQSQYELISKYRAECR